MPAVLFRNLVLSSLAVAAREGQDHLARRALQGTDPLVGWWLRRRLAGRIAWAGACFGDSSDRRHVLRLAFLKEAGLAESVDFEDRMAVAAAFGAASDKPPPGRLARFWFASAAILCLTLFVASGGWYVRTRNNKPSFSPLDSPLGHALGEELTGCETELNRLRRAAKTQQPAVEDLSKEGESATARVGARFGDFPGKSQLQALLSDYRSIALAPNEDGSERDVLYSAVMRFNGWLRSDRWPYLVDTLEDPRSGPLLISYYIARERVVRVEDATILVAQVQRLDSLNRGFAAVGYTRPHLGAALVEMDMLERQAVTLVAPALAGKAARLVDSETRDSGDSWISQVEDLGSEVMRRDYLTWRSPELDRVIELLAERSKLFLRLQRATVSDNLSLVEPTRLVVRGSLDRLEGRVLDSELRAWDRINEELDQEPMHRAFEALVGRLAQGVERHELQHQIDYRRGLIPIPGELRTMLGLSETVDLAPTSNAVRCRDELSAELAAIASAEESGGTVLVLASESLLNRSSWATPHAYAAAVILAAVAQELGIESRGPYVSGRFDRAGAAALLVALGRQPSSAVTQAARRAYGRLFGADLPALDWGEWRTAQPWGR